MYNEFYQKGAKGLEIYCDYNNKMQKEYYLIFARKNNCIITMGSESQGASESDSKIGTIQYPDWVIENMKKNGVI